MSVDLRLRRFDEVPATTWDAWVASLPEATYVHSWMYVRFCHLMLGEAQAQSFAVLDNRGSVVALCPLGISRGEVDGRGFTEASWNGAPLGRPAIRPELPAQRRRLVGEVFEILHGEMRRHGVARSLLLGHPISLGVLKGDGRPVGQVETLAAGYACQAQNTIIMDLSVSLDELSGGLTREQRKHLYQSERRGLRVREFSGERDGLDEMHRQYQDAHRKAAGRLTRPEASFDWMLQLAREARLRLFVAFAGEIPVSFLYCGEFEEFAVGWSQANVEEHESAHSPRHLLEWSAMLSYRERKFKHYEIGRRFYGPQLYKVPTPKERSISFFKERYGGQLWPYLVFERFFDGDVCRLVYQQRLQEFLDGNDFRD